MKNYMVLSTVLTWSILFKTGRKGQLQNASKETTRATRMFAEMEF
jgi:hypothetical protein